MKKTFLLGTILLSAFVLTSCGINNNITNSVPTSLPNNGTSVKASSLSEKIVKAYTNTLASSGVELNASLSKLNYSMKVPAGYDESTKQNIYSTLKASGSFDLNAKFTNFSDLDVSKIQASAKISKLNASVEGIPGTTKKYSLSNGEAAAYLKDGYGYADISNQATRNVINEVYADISSSNSSTISDSYNLADSIPGKIKTRSALNSGQFSFPTAAEVTSAVGNAFTENGSLIDACVTAKTYENGSFALEVSLNDTDMAGLFAGLVVSDISAQSYKDLVAFFKEHITLDKFVIIVVSDSTCRLSSIYSNIKYAVSEGKYQDKYQGSEDEDGFEHNFYVSLVETSVETEESVKLSYENVTVEYPSDLNSYVTFPSESSSAL